MNDTYAYLLTHVNGTDSGWVAQFDNAPAIAVISKRTDRSPSELMLDALNDFHNHIPDSLSDTFINIILSTRATEFMDEEEMLPPNVFIAPNAMRGRRRGSLQRAFVDHKHKTLTSLTQAGFAAGAALQNERQSSGAYLSELDASDVLVTVTATVPLRYDSGENFTGSAYAVTHNGETVQKSYGRQFNGMLKKRKAPCTGLSAKTSMRPLDRIELLRGGLNVLREALNLVLSDYGTSESLRLMLALDNPSMPPLITGEQMPTSTTQMIEVNQLLSDVLLLLARFPSFEIVPQDFKDSPKMLELRSLCKLGAESVRDEYMASNHDKDSTSVRRQNLSFVRTGADHDREGIAILRIVKQS